MSTDPFETARIRAATMATWRAMPARFREDANTEEDYGHTYYRDRVLVDLAQNAADAAVAAAVPGRLLIRLEPHRDRWLLTVANTGVPLDAQAVGALSSLRASTKRERTDQIGRYGVGFAAVRAVSDDIAVCSSSGSVEFSVAATRDLFADAPVDLAVEFGRRGDRLPVLRMPFASPCRPVTGYDTAVVLLLRDDDALAAVRRQIGLVGDSLLLALPALTEIVIDVEGEPSRRLANVEDRWLVHRTSGEFALQKLADRPVEERHLTHWEITWAVPRQPDITWDPVLHAPTPTDNSCSLPALLLGSFPLDPTRRTVATGPITEELLAEAAAAYGELVGRFARGEETGIDTLHFVPTGWAAGEIDGQLRQRISADLRQRDILQGPEGLVAPNSAQAIAGPAGQDPGLVAVFSTWFPGLVTVPPAGDLTLRTLRVPLRLLGDLVDELPEQPRPVEPAGADFAEPDPTTGPELDLPPTAEPDPTTDPTADPELDLAPTSDPEPAPDPTADPELDLPPAPDPTGWHKLYDAAARTLPGEAEAWATIPVQLVGGRLVRGARGTTILERLEHLTPNTVATLTGWGLRLVDPAAAHPVLGQLGAVSSDLVALLATAAVRDALVRDEDPAAVSAVVLDLLRCSTDPPVAAPVLGLVELPAADGDAVPAHGLVIPGSVAADLFDTRVVSPVASQLVTDYGETVLTTLGVRARPVVVRVQDQAADPAAVDLDGTDDAALTVSGLDGWVLYLQWLAARKGPVWIDEMTAIADLDAIRADRWPQFLQMVAADPQLRAAVMTPVRGDGFELPSYSAWWIRHRAGLGIEQPWALADPLPWLGSRPEALAGIDEALCRALGAVGSLSDLTAENWAQVLSDMGGPGTVVPLAEAVVVWQGLAGADLRSVPFLPALTGPGRAVVTALPEILLADEPMWWQRTDLGPLLPTPDPADTAARSGLTLASRWADGEISTTGEAESLPPAVVALLQVAGLDLDSWMAHDELVVDGMEVEWWVDDTHRVHAVHLAGAAAGIAQLARRWQWRWALETALADPQRAGDALLDLVLSGRSTPQR